MIPTQLCEPFRRGFVHNNVHASVCIVKKDRVRIAATVCQSQNLYPVIPTCSFPPHMIEQLAPTAESSRDLKRTAPRVDSVRVNVDTSLVEPRRIGRNHGGDHLGTGSCIVGSGRSRLRDLVRSCA